jgi:hypothetical protein
VEAGAHKLVQIVVLLLQCLPYTYIQNLDTMFRAAAAAAFHSYVAGMNNEQLSLYVCSNTEAPLHIKLHWLAQRSASAR